MDDFGTGYSWLSYLRSFPAPRQFLRAPRGRPPVKRAAGWSRAFPSGQPNDLWRADYKDEFMLADRRYCYPLTITGFASRYLFACEARSTAKEAYAFPVFEVVSKEYGRPRPSTPITGSPSQVQMLCLASATFPSGSRARIEKRTLLAKVRIFSRSVGCSLLAVSNSAKLIRAPWVLRGS